MVLGDAAKARRQLVLHAKARKSRQDSFLVVVAQLVITKSAVVTGDADLAAGHVGALMLRDRAMVRPIGIVPKGDKNDRFAAQAARIEEGHVYLPWEAEWRADFLNEILAFPAGRHDDQVDSLSQFLLWVTSRRFEAPISIALPIYGNDFD